MITDSQVEQAMAVLASFDREPNWRQAYANLYHRYAALREELAEMHRTATGEPFEAYLAELRRVTGDKVQLTVEYCSDPNTPPTFKLYDYGGQGFTNEHNTAEGARLNMLAKVADYVPTTDPKPKEAKQLLEAAKPAAEADTNDPS